MISYLSKVYWCLLLAVPFVDSGSILDEVFGDGERIPLGRFMKGRVALQIGLVHTSSVLQ